MFLCRGYRTYFSFFGKRKVSKRKTKNI